MNGECVRSVGALFACVDWPSTLECFGFFPSSALDVERETIGALTRPGRVQAMTRVVGGVCIAKLTLQRLFST